MSQDAGHNPEPTTRRAHAGARPVFPVALLSAGRRCLVVGGGVIGTRKAKLLLDAEADVTVVAPAVSDKLADLAVRGDLRVEHHEYCSEDLDGMALVFAATGDAALNHAILEDARARGVLACSVDRNWSRGAFITPATVRREGVCVSVSTGGKSCRFSRLIKDSLGRHLDMIQSADLAVIGTSHRQLTVSEREPLHLVNGRLERVGRMLMHVWGVHDFVLLNTCNRVELMAVVSEQTLDNDILPKLLGMDELPPERYYLHRGMGAFVHSALVTSGLLSQTPGEKHIVSQLKDALDTASAQGWAGSLMGEWVSTTLHMAKHIRAEFDQRLQQVEIEDMCLRFLEDRAGRELTTRRILVIGAGDIGAGLVQRLSEAGCRCTWCYHRTIPTPPTGNGPAPELVPLSALRECLPLADTVLCATGGGRHVLHTAYAPFLNPETQTEIIDLAIPRNVDPQLTRMVSDLTVADLDDLKHWFRRERLELDVLRDRAVTIVREHTASYEKLIGSVQHRNAGQ